jgi:hypothetical protein
VRLSEARPRNGVPVRPMRVSDVTPCTYLVSVISANVESSPVEVVVR